MGKTQKPRGGKRDGAGRPARAGGPRTPIGTTMDAAERERTQELASRAGLSVAEWIRKRSLTPLRSRQNESSEIWTARAQGERLVFFHPDEETEA